MATVDSKVGLTDNIRIAIRDIMKERGMRQGEIAAMLGISQASVSRKMNPGPKASGITLDDLERIAMGLGLDVRVRFSTMNLLWERSENGSS